MSNVNERIIQQKEKLAAKALQVAEDSLGLLQDQLSDCSARDLVSVFNASVKAHREIVSDIITLSDTESKEESAMAKDFAPHIQKLLNRVQSNKEQ